MYLQNNPRAHTKRYFKRFILVLEHEDSEYGYSEDQADKVGSLAIINYSTTTFNEDCRNSIVATNDVQISKIAVSNKITQPILAMMHSFAKTKIFPYHRSYQPNANL